jgi:hypothetical protein
MWFAYMDEAGNTGRKCDDPSQPIHLILTLVVEESRVRDLHEHVRETARLHCPDDCADPDFEFHGYDLFAGRGAFAGVKPAKRIAIYDEILKGIELAQGEVIIRGVEKTGLARRYTEPFHPHDVALMYTIESVERAARARDCRVLLVADEAKEIERIVDTIHFVPSHRNGAIQVTDCATFIAARLRKIHDGLVGDNSSARVVEKLWEERILPYVGINQVWYPTP